MYTYNTYDNNIIYDSVRTCTKTRNNIMNFSRDNGSCGRAGIPVGRDREGRSGREGAGGGVADRCTCWRSDKTPINLLCLFNVSDNRTRSRRGGKHE